GRPQFVLGDLGQGARRAPADILPALLANPRLGPDRLIDPAQDAPPLLVIADDLPDGVQHVPALGVHVARALVVDAVGGDDRPVVTDAAARPDGVTGAGLLPEEALGVEPFGLVGESLVPAHV